MTDLIFQISKRNRMKKSKWQMADVDGRAGEEIFLPPVGPGYFRLVPAGPFLDERSGGKRG
jgi:hypothetical protein